jgi:hypothetical protein
VALVRKLNRYVKKFGKEFPGISFQRTDAVRLFVERGLAGPVLPEHSANADETPRKIGVTGKPKQKGKRKKDTKVSRRREKRKPVTKKTKPRKKR